MTAPRPANWRPLPVLSPQTDPEEAIYRAAALSRSTPEERASCPESLTWIDLRTRMELDQDPKNPLPAGWTHLHTPFMEVEFAAGQVDHGLDDLISREKTFGDHYCTMLDVATEGVVTAIRTVADTSGPLVIGCQGGRDRTGVISALLLLIAGADRQVIVDDYVRTNDDLAKNLARQPGGEQTQQLFAKLDLVCHPEDISQALDHIETRGGVREYLAPHLDDTEFDRIRDRVRVRFGLPPLDLSDTPPAQKELAQ